MGVASSGAALKYRRDFMVKYDAVVIGGGAAGLAASIYLARAQYTVLVIEKEKFGGQITITSEVVNYPGIISTDGKKLTEGMRIQAENFGAEFMLAQVEKIDFSGEVKKIYTDKGEIETYGIVLATGASPRRAGFKGEEEFRGRGVAYCATCDGEFFTGKEVFVVGGGFAAAEEAIFLTKYARKVTILVRGESFTCAESIVEEVLKNDLIEVRYNTEVKEVGGESSLQYAVFEDKKERKIYRYDSQNGENFGMFVFAGYEPANKLFKDVLETDERGYLVTDRNQKTSEDAVYGAGDICIKNLRQVVTAVSDGAIAATSLEKDIYAVHRKYGIKREPMKKSKPEVNKETSENTSLDSFIDDNIKESLKPVFEKFENNITVKVNLNNTAFSNELKGFSEEFSKLCDKIKFVYEEISDDEPSSMMIYDVNGEYTGIRYCAVPGGHEFNSFIIALYNAAGPGQPIDSKIKGKIESIDKNIDIKIAISLSCTMCPELVMAVQKAASLNKNINVSIYDIMHFEELKNRYSIMSVPCMIINDEQVMFGKKNITELSEILASI